MAPFGADLRHADLTRVDLERNRMAFQREKMACDREERVRDREERRIESLEAQKL